MGTVPVAGDGVRQRTRVVAALGTAQTLAWASTYYLPAMLAAPMARELGVSVPTVFAAFSTALAVSALAGPYAGGAIDRWGGRPVLVGTSLVFALGLVGLGLAQGPIALFAAWIVIGLGMGSGLYEAAFSALVRLYGSQSRNAITGITLIAGFASTVGWPLTTLLEAELGWRGACFAWAGLHLLLGAPLNASLPRAPRDGARASVADTGDSAATAGSSGNLRAAILLSFVFAVTWFVSTAMAAHLPALVMAGGATLATAVAVGALVGPAQVAGRLVEFGLLRRVHPLLSARLASLMHPLGAAVLSLAGAPGAAAFALLHGAGNGILTIAKGTLPLVLFGPLGYGARQGLLMVPARIAQAMAPWVFGIGLERWGAGALWLSSALSIAAFGALMLLRRVGPEARWSTAPEPGRQ
ncbi:MAG TPA: MFS transporter [Burkholderiaceae bacterium]|jgi:predicted MFS family arabinose efflux permease|nr:MFS transporter [Burkholderiaceae bacterium]